MHGGQGTVIEHYAVLSAALAGDTTQSDELTFALEKLQNAQALFRVSRGRKGRALNASMFVLGSL